MLLTEKKLLSVRNAKIIFFFKSYRDSFGFVCALKIITFNSMHLFNYFIQSIVVDTSWRMPLTEQKLFTLLEHLFLPLVIIKIPVVHLLCLLVDCIHGGNHDTCYFTSARAILTFWFPSESKVCFALITASIRDDSPTTRHSRSGIKNV